MSFVKIYSAQANLLDADRVDIEADISNGLHSFSIVGLPDKSIQEAKDRVSSAIKNSGLISPKQQNQKVTISLAPAELQKSGSSFDVPIALAYLQASKQIKIDFENKIFVGELALDGQIRKINSILPILLYAKNQKISEIYIPKENENEAKLIGDLNIFPANNLSEIINHLNGKIKIEKIKYNFDIQSTKNEIDFSEIKGNQMAKRAVLISASGGHNIGFYGPPGTGKSMMAKSFIGIIPKLNKQQIIEVSSIHSFRSKESQIIIDPPFRTPHHSASYSSIIGGGNNIKPGEITLAHNGVLFMDEFPEFDRRVIESIRQPLEDRFIIISRANKTIKYPANFILIIAMNPCPCGFYQTNIKKCQCSPQSILNYQKKISGPIVDRIDIWADVYKTEHKLLLEKNKDEYYSTEKMSDIVKKTRGIQIKRTGGLNAEMNNFEIKKYCQISNQTKDILDKASEKLNISARSYFKILKIARTIADLEGFEEIKTPHILEAIQYRQKNKWF